MKTALWVFMTIGAWLTFNEPAVRENWHWQQEFTGNWCIKVRPHTSLGGSHNSGENHIRIAAFAGASVVTFTLFNNTAGPTRIYHHLHRLSSYPPLAWSDPSVTPASTAPVPVIYAPAAAKTRHTFASVELTWRVLKSKVSPSKQTNKFIRSFLLRMLVQNLRGLDL